MAFAGQNARQLLRNGEGERRFRLAEGAGAWFGGAGVAGVDADDHVDRFLVIV